MNIELSELPGVSAGPWRSSDVDLRAGPGVFGLLGPNGAGKTTLAADDGHCRPTHFRHGPPTARP